MLLFRRRSGAPATPREIKQGLGIGAFATAGTLFQTDGMQFTDASTSAFLTQFSAILIPAWLALSHRRSPGLIVWLGCILVLAGVGILGHFDWRTLRFGRGEWETLLSSIFFMGQILWVGKREFSGNRPGPVTLVLFSLQGAAFLALAAATAPRRARAAHALAVARLARPDPRAHDDLHDRRVLDHEPVAAQDHVDRRRA